MPGGVSDGVPGSSGSVSEGVSTSTTLAKTITGVMQHHPIQLNQLFRLCKNKCNIQ